MTRVDPTSNSPGAYGAGAPQNTALQTYMMSVFADLLAQGNTSLEATTKLMKAAADTNNDLAAYGKAMNDLKLYGSGKVPGSGPPEKTGVEEMQDAYAKLFGANGTGGDYANFPNDDTNPLYALKNSLDTGNPSLSSLLQQQPAPKALTDYADKVKAGDAAATAAFNNIMTGYQGSATAVNGYSQLVGTQAANMQNMIERVLTAMSKVVDNLNDVNKHTNQEMG